MQLIIQLTQKNRQYLRLYVRINLILIPPTILSLCWCHYVTREAIVSQNAPVSNTEILMIFLYVFVWLMVFYEVWLIARYYQKLDSELMGQLNDYYFMLKKSQCTNSEPQENGQHKLTTPEILESIQTIPEVGYKLFQTHILSPWDIVIGSISDNKMPRRF